MKLATEIAEEMTYCATGTEIDGWTKVAMQDGDEHRWEREMTAVVKSPTGEHFAFDWRSGLTESQEDRYPWDVYGGQDLPSITVYPVTAHEVVSTEWRRVK